MIYCSTYDRADGLPALQCADMYQPSAWRGHDGKLWFATDKGVVGVQPEEVQVNVRPPPVVIEEFLVDGEIQARPPETKSRRGKIENSARKTKFRISFIPRFR